MSARGRWTAAAAAALTVAAMLTGCAVQGELYIDITDVRLAPDGSRAQTDGTARRQSAGAVTATSRGSQPTFVLPAGTPGRVEVRFASNTTFSRCELHFLGTHTVYPTLDTATQRYLVSVPTAAMVAGRTAQGSLQCIPTDERYYPFADGFTVTVQDAGTLDLSTASVDVGAQEEGVPSAAHVVRVSNTGGAPVTIATVTVAGAQAGWFTATGCAGQTVAPGSLCEISVVATPPVLGSGSATVTIDSDALGRSHSFSVAVVGVMGGGTPVFTPSTGADNLVLYLNSTIPYSAMTISNTGTGSARLHLTGMTIEGGSGRIELRGDPTDTQQCASVVATGAGIPPGEFCRVYLIYLQGPDTVTAELVVTDNASGSPHRIPIVGIPG